MMEAGSLIILSQALADSQRHIVYLSTSPATFLSPLKKKRKVRRKKKTGGGANKWSSVSSIQRGAGRYDRGRTYREETHGEIIQPEVT